MAAPDRSSGQSRAPLGRFFRWVSEKFEHGFERLAEAYQGSLDWALEHGRLVLIVFLLFAVLSLVLIPFLGRDFFPTVDAGQLRFHVRCPPGTRIEESEVEFQRAEDYPRRLSPPRS